MAILVSPQIAPTGLPTNIHAICTTRHATKATPHQAQVSCCILQASRDHYCIHPTVSKKSNKDEECQNLLKDDPGCKFFKNVNKLFSMQTNHFLLVGMVQCCCLPYSSCLVAEGCHDLVDC